MSGCRCGARAGIAIGLVSLALVGCGPDAVRADRTGGRTLEYLWSIPSERRAAFYLVSTDGSFASSGGSLALDRAASDRTTLSDADVGEFLQLLEGSGFRDRPDGSCDGEPLHQVRVRADGATHAFEVCGIDASLEALRNWCASVALRKYRDVIDAQPEAGARRR